MIKTTLMVRERTLAIVQKGGPKLKLIPFEGETGLGAGEA